MSPLESTPIAPSPGSAAQSPLSVGGLAPKPMVTKIVTSRAWVLPPRPKPGRKPSADTPATKRKAQNRAAQRAFRERRATRVAELEEKLSEVEREKDTAELSYRNMVTKLQSDNKTLMKTLNDMRLEFNTFKQSLSNSNTSVGTAVFSNGQVTSPSPLNYFKPSPGVNHDYRFQNASQQQQQQQHLRQPPSQPISPAVSSPQSHPSATTSISSKDDCGNCEKDDCICEQVGLRERAPLKLLKRSAPVSLKRSNEVEVDYTALFAKKKPRSMPKLKKKKPEADAAETREYSAVLANITDTDFESPMEQCGFCSDDSPCVCREAAKEAANAITELQNSRKSSLLPPISRNSSVSAVNKLPVMHPGPSMEISRATSTSTATTTNTTTTEKKAGCTGNPGTCSQCQLDPMSTLFCTTIASKAGEGTGSPTSSVKPEENKSPVSPPVSTHSSKVSSPTVLQEDELISMLKKPETASTPGGSSDAGRGIYIPCADAYKTLSRHKGFHLVDFGTLVGKLTTRGMQVEVQSVANVLRELDRRYTVE